MMLDEATVTEITVFKSLGLAVEDVAADLVYRRYRRAIPV